MTGGAESLVELVSPTGRLDRALADALPELSRARVQALMLEGAITRGGNPVSDPSAKAAAGIYRLVLPELRPAEPQAEDIALTVLFEDAHLIVIDKPAGMAAHPAPGSARRAPWSTPCSTTAALSLSGIGGVARPGIVHRLDKDTSGVMVAAKTDAAHRGLSALFAAHDIERVYIALTRGAPDAGAGDDRPPASAARPATARRWPCCAPAAARRSPTMHVERRFRPGRQAAGRPGRLPAGDRPHPPDPRAPGAQGRAVPGRSRLWLRRRRRRRCARRSRRPA